MALPLNILYGPLVAASTTYIGTGTGTTSGLIALNATTTFPTFQQRISVVSAGNDSSIFFQIIGLNQANHTIAELLAGANATAAVSNLDYLTVISIQPKTATGSLATTSGTVTVGSVGTGSSLWNYMNWHVSPTNIELFGTVYNIPSIATAGATWSFHYTYDDPSSPPLATTVVQVFNHPTLNNQTGSADGPVNDPVTAIRMAIISGTGTVRGSIIQAGIGSP